MNKKMPDMQFPPPIVMKDGKRKNVQRYKCMACGLRFSGVRNKKEIWEMYLNGKQTILRISKTTGLNVSTVTRRLASISFCWE